MSTAAASGSRLPLPAAMAFAATSLPLTALNTAIAIYLPRHFASHIGISLAAVGSAFAIVRLIDIGVDFTLGLVMDRTRTRWGRYRVWLAAGAPLLMLAVYMLFVASAAADEARLIVWLLVLYLGTSVLGLSHSAWAATLVTNYNERSRMFGIIAAFGVIGSLLVFLIPVLLHGIGVADAKAVPAMGWFLMLATPLAVATVVLATPERIRPNTGGHDFRLGDYWALIAQPAMRRIILADFCLALGPGWLSASVLFFLTDARGFTLTQANILLAISISAGFLGAPLVGRLAMRVSKHRALVAAAFGYVVTLCLTLILPKGALAFAAPNMFAMGFFAAGFTVLLRAMTADVSDELRLTQGRERAGLLYAITTLTAKIAGALSIFLTFTVLEQVGYKAGAHTGNPDEAIRGLEMASIAGPVVFVLVGAACLAGYKLGPARHAEIRRLLQVRDAEGEASGLPGPH